MNKSNDALSRFLSFSSKKKTKKTKNAFKKLNDRYEKQEIKERLRKAIKQAGLYNEPDEYEKLEQMNFLFLVSDCLDLLI